MTDKNPKPLNIPYGKFTTTLTVTDLITGETITKNLNIIHTPLPKQSKKPSVRHTSQNFTLDLKDLPNDIGGGAPAPEEPQKNLLLHIILALLISIIVGFMFRKHPIAKP